MPIKPENRHRYPANWPQIRAQILERDRHRCAHCGLQNYAVGWRDPHGIFHRARGNGPQDAAGEGRLWPWWSRATAAYSRHIRDLNNTCGDCDEDGHRWIMIVLTIAHLEDERPENCDPANLAALCQRCHLQYDTKRRLLSSRKTYPGGKTP